MADMTSLCDSFGDIYIEYFKDGTGIYQEYPQVYHWMHLPKIRAHIDKIARIVEVCDLVGIKDLEEAKPNLQKIIHRLGEEREETRNRKLLYEMMVELKTPFISNKAKLKRVHDSLDARERERVNEALHDYLEGAHYSSVAMSVSAIENRLLILMKQFNPAEKDKLDKMTLGQMITEYLEHEDNTYHNLLHSRHKPLLQLCNTYRIFSVHPKEERINKKVATSILNLTLEFLLDKATRYN